MDDDDEVRPGPVAPVGTLNGRLTGTLLAIVALLAVVLAVSFVHADVDSMADAGWQDNALWAAGLGAALVGVALGVLAWNAAVPGADSTMARTAAVVAVFGVVTAVIVLGLADARGGQRARSDAVVTAVGAEGTSETTSESFAAEEPVPLDEVTDPEHLTSAAFPITVRTFVALELTAAGRQIIADAMGCPARALARNEVLGTAVGGTWVQPLVVIGPPVNAAGGFVAPCRRVAARIAPEMGFAVPRV